MTILEAVKEFLQTYAPLANERINVDFLDEEAQSYSVETVPGDEWVKRYVDGTGVKQFTFILASRNVFGQELAQQFENIGFYEAFANWLDEKSRAGDLPILPDGNCPISILANTGGYVMFPGTDTARYQIQCKLTYTVTKGR